MTTGTYTKDMEVLDVTMPNITGTGDNTSAVTNNFLVKVAIATNDTFLATAQRVNAGTTTPASGDQQYAIMSGINASGALFRWCATSPATTLQTSFGTQIDNKTCKSIANNSYGQIK